jgi:hypothetical protein
MKIALCFIINYDHILNKEHIWKEWIEPNKDIINVYFYYKDLKKIKSKWIIEHTIPPNFIHQTTYFHVIPAYVSSLQFAMNHDIQNEWFCMLTDSCCPIISPKKFRHLFYNNRDKSIFSWKPAWWNPYYHHRGNLAKLSKELWLANDPWFILTKENVKQIMFFMNTQENITKTICSGGLANETLFAVIFKCYKELGDNSTLNSRIICESSHLADWNRRSSTTSPHVFKDADEDDINFIDRELERNKFACFIRKISPVFPDNILRHYIYEHDKDNDNRISLVEPREMLISKYSIIIGKGINILLTISIFYLIFIYYII